MGPGERGSTRRDNGDRIHRVLPLPATSGGAGEKDLFVNTSVAAAGEPIRSATDMRIRTAALLRMQEIFRELAYQSRVSPLIVKLVVVGE